jgi:hypothetical protein
VWPATIRTKIHVTFSTTKNSNLQGGLGTDWFWYTAPITTDRVGRVELMRKDFRKKTAGPKDPAALRRLWTTRRADVTS